MKKCPSCLKEKSATEFHKRSRAKDGLQSMCKDCNRTQRNQYYKSARGKAINNASGRKWSEQIRIKLVEFLVDKECQDCGLKDFRILEFDHRDPKQKSFNIGEATSTGNYGWSTILTEIDKCDIVCSNCHRIRTQKMFGHIRYKYWELMHPSSSG